jgi:hypothetical protein
MGHFATSVKTDWNSDPNRLLSHATGIAEKATAMLRSQGVFDGIRRRKATPAGGFRTLDPEVKRLLLTDSISPLPLHKTLVLLEAIGANGSDRFSHYERLAVAKALVSFVSNLRFGPEVGLGEIRADAPVVPIWHGCVEQIARDLTTLRKLPSCGVQLCRGDARRVADLLPAESVDIVITSPPYPNEKDYTRTTRLETVVLGFVRTKADLQELKRSLVRSNTRGVYKADDDDRWVSKHRQIARIAEAIEKRRLELGKDSGFERLYAKVTRLYFGGMARHLADLRAVLRPGAQLAYVVGDQASYLRVMIRTGTLLGEIADSLGYEVVGLDLFRERLATATKEYLREEVLVLRWPGLGLRSKKPRSNAGNR